MLLYASIMVSFLRLVFASVFCIITQSTLLVAPIVLSLVCIGLAIYSERSTTFTPDFFYGFVSLVLSTTWWSLILFYFNTDDSCHKLGDFICEDKTDEPGQLRRPHAWWIVLMIPGTIFDCTFMVFAHRYKNLETENADKAHPQILLHSSTVKVHKHTGVNAKPENFREGEIVINL